MKIVNQTTGRLQVTYFDDDATNPSGSCGYIDPGNDAEFPVTSPQEVDITFSAEVTYHNVIDQVITVSSNISG